MTRSTWAANLKSWLAGQRPRLFKPSSTERIIGPTQQKLKTEDLRIFSGGEEVCETKLSGKVWRICFAELKSSPLNFVYYFKRDWTVSANEWAISVGNYNLTTPLNFFIRRMTFQNHAGNLGANYLSLFGFETALPLKPYLQQRKIQINSILIIMKNAILPANNQVNISSQYATVDNWKTVKIKCYKNFRFQTNVQNNLFMKFWWLSRIDEQQ